MDISKLDEWQGVTPQLVTDWLLQNGWMQTKPRWWERGEDAFTFDSATFDQLWFWTHALAAIYTNGNVQALIREINPRMREITDGAFRSHSFNGGWWIVEDANREPTVRRIILKWCSDTGQQRAKGWPCDEHGNKLRWPTDAEGNML